MQVFCPKCSVVSRLHSFVPHISLRTLSLHSAVAPESKWKSDVPECRHRVPSRKGLPSDRFLSAAALPCQVHEPGESSSVNIQVGLGRAFGERGDCKDEEVGDTLPLSAKADECVSATAT